MCPQMLTGERPRPAALNCCELGLISSNISDPSICFRSKVQRRKSGTHARICRGAFNCGTPSGIFKHMGLQ